MIKKFESSFIYKKGDKKLHLMNMKYTAGYTYEHDGRITRVGLEKAEVHKITW